MKSSGIVSQKWPSWSILYASGPTWRHHLCPSWSTTLAAILKTWRSAFFEDHFSGESLGLGWNFEKVVSLFLSPTKFPIFEVPLRYQSWKTQSSRSLWGINHGGPNLRGPFEVSIMEDPTFEVPLRYQSWRTQPSRSRKWKIVGKRLWVAVWPDLAKLRHFGKNLEVWRALDGVYFVFGLILSPLG